jgi:hypothetical protein
VSVITGAGAQMVVAAAATIASAKVGDATGHNAAPIVK